MVTVTHKAKCMERFVRTGLGNCMNKDPICNTFYIRLYNEIKCLYNLFLSNAEKGIKKIFITILKHEYINEMI